ncbi:MAG TPA: GDSL-type esterase/lipase family protein [Candidatus Polarisedimenticolia bacterium]|nr:GDSL-type esterase/lipase family protein [Candidatus Polarisedimenticolia bacterium]
MPRARRQASFSGRRQASFILLLILLLLAGFEAGARAIVSYPPIFRRVARQSSPAWRLEWAKRRRSSLPAPYTFDVYDPERGWALQGGLRSFTMPEGKSLSTSSRGVRSEVEIPYEHPARGRRIAVLGDSFTFGEGVSDREAYPFVLDQLLAEHEVINFGVHGYGLDQMLLYLRTEVVKYRPDVVVLGYVDEDIYRNLLSFRDYAKPRYLLLSDRSLRLENVPVARPEDLLSTELLYPRALDLIEMTLQARRWRNGANRREAQTISRAILEEIVHSVRGAKAVPLFVYLPVADDLLDRSPALNRGERFLSSVCARAGLRFHSLRPGISAAIDPADRRAARGHWPARVHALAAAGIRDILIAEGEVDHR